MHELSLVRNIFASLEEEFGAEKMETIKTVRLKIGLLANVEPLLLQNAFKAHQASFPKLSHISLESIMIDIQIQCPACNHISKVENYSFKCRNCATPSNNIISGEELLIHEVVYLE